MISFDPLYRALTDAALLQRLRATDPAGQERAWREFLRRYSRLLLKVIGQFEQDTDAVMEKYVYVCTRLSADDFSVLRKFDVTRSEPPPRLSTWLTIVVKNLCVEQHRRQHGRKRYPKALAAMSDFERKVFELYYWKGYTRAEITHILTTHSPANGVADVLERIDALGLRPSKTWFPQQPTLVPFEENRHRGSDSQPQEVLEAVWFEDLLHRLDDEERLVVRLRFWEDLTASEIARLLHPMTQRRVYTLLERAIIVRDKNERLGIEH